MLQLGMQQHGIKVVKMIRRMIRRMMKLPLLLPQVVQAAVAVDAEQVIMPQDTMTGLETGYAIELFCT